jgi:polysaccharide export outer membrane protein
LSSVKLRDLLAGKLDANLYVQPGDIVSVPEADQIYVTGSVNKPGAYALTTKMTLTQAVALAGGVNMEGAKNRVRLIRQDSNSDKKSEKMYNLGDISKRKIEDVTLMPNDIIEVPDSMFRTASRNMLGVSISMLSALPYFIIR